MTVGPRSARKLEFWERRRVERGLDSRGLNPRSKQKAKKRHTKRASFVLKGQDGKEKEEGEEEKEGPYVLGPCGYFVYGRFLILVSGLK